VKDGDELISVVTLDEELRNEQITFIKMDLEGWEINALRGAEQTIKKTNQSLQLQFITRPKTSEKYQNLS